MSPFVFDVAEYLRQIQVTAGTQNSSAEIETLVWRRTIRADKSGVERVTLMPPEASAGREIAADENVGSVRSDEGSVAPPVTKHNKRVSINTL